MYFYAVFNLYIIFLLFIYILFIIMYFRFKKGKYDIIWPINILKFCLPLISTSFFGQEFLLLITVFICQNGKTYFDEKMACRTGSWYSFSCPTAIIAILIQIMLSYVSISMNYYPDFFPEAYNFMKKRSSFPDVIFMFSKILIIIIFIFDKQKDYEHWGILFVLCFITGLNAYVTLFLQYYENIIIKKLNYFYSLFLFWGFLSLFISKIFKSWEFRGGLYLFILGIILIFIYCVFYAKTYLEFINLNPNNINTSQEYINYIKSYINILDKKEISRDNSMVLTSFIEKAEEGCTNKNCLLKKYLISLSQGFDSNFILLQYAQKLFKFGINKFPRDITLKIHYIIFLLTKINQKKNAQKELLSIKKNIFNLNDSFNLFRCKKYIQDYSSIKNRDQQEEGIENNSFFIEIEYQNKVKEFKKLLSKSSSLYYDFWSSLYSSHLQGTEDVKKLSDIGAELNQLIENIEKVFEKLREIKSNDYEIIKLYESYLKNILNDKEKYEKYYNISMNLLIDNKIENKEIDYTNFDLKILKKEDEYKFLIISANNENKGTIIDMSLNSCSVFGYHKHELIGKSMNLLIPEIYHKIHDNVFNDICEKTKIEFFEKLSKKIIYTPKFIEFSAFGRNKSKYLIPLDFKVFFTQTEENDLVYITDFAKKKSMNKEFFEDNENDKNQFYCVLTDNNFIIQTFTSNCVEFLGLNSNIINSNQDITSYIKQFNEELQSMFASSNRDFSGVEASELKSIDNSYKDVNNSNTNANDKSIENKIKLKKKLIKLKYSNERKITWKMTNNDKKYEYQSDISKTQISLFSPHIYKNKNSLNEFIEKKNDTQKKIIMEVKEAYISKKHIGYYFYFKKIKNENGLNFNCLEKIKKDNLSPKNKSNFKRPSVKFLPIEEETPKSSRMYKNEDVSSILTKSSFTKLSNDVKKKYSNVNFDLDSNKHLQKYGSDKLLSSINEMNNIDDKFIPNCNFNFFLDLSIMSYKPSIKLNSYKRLYNLLKKESIEKFKSLSKIKKNKDETSLTSNTENSSKDDNNSSYDDSSSYITSSQSNYSSSNKSNVIDNKNKYIRKNNKRKGSLIQKDPINHRTENKNNNSQKNNNNNNLKSETGLDDQYYRININKIKFMIYDFNQEMAINYDKIEKRSQVEIVLDNYKSRQNVNISEDDNFAHLSFEKYTKDSKNKNKNKKEKKESSENLKNTNLFDKEKEFEKEVIYALSKQDDQNSIKVFYNISLLFLIIILGMGVVEIYFINYHYNKLKENLSLIILATNLKYYTNYGIYYIREYNLYSINNNITNGIYIVPDEDSEFYKNNISESAKNIFIQCNSILENIIGTGFEFCPETVYKLTEEPFYIEIIYSDSTIKKVNTTFETALIQIYSSLCNILVNFDNLPINHPNLFAFLHNSFNSLAQGLNNQIDLFINEFILRDIYIKKYLIVICCVYLILHIFLFCIICSSYTSIVLRKSSYISVFYGIGLSLIKSSIKKCEFFINKINQNEDINKDNDFEEEVSSFVFSTNNNLNSIFSDNNFQKNIRSINYNKRKKIKKRRKVEEDKNSRKFRKKYQIFLIISFFYLVSIYCTFLLLTKKFKRNGNYIKYLTRFQNNIIELFNGYREYLFNENSIIMGLTAYEYLIYKEKAFYSNNKENYIFMNNNLKKIKNLASIYSTLEQNLYCKSFIYYFNSTEQCEEYMGGKDGIISLGFDLVSNLFIEEVRTARNYMKFLLDENILIGNLSKTINSDDNDVTFNLTDGHIFRMKVFNMEETHKRLNIIFVNIILQYINKVRDLSLYTIEKSTDDGHKIYILATISYIIIFILIFCFYWIPMINTLNVEIYKTKKMLSIIPVQILASLPNIRELLNISINNN